MMLSEREMLNIREIVILSRLTYVSTHEVSTHVYEVVKHPARKLKTV